MILIIFIINRSLVILKLIINFKIHCINYCHINLNIVMKLKDYIRKFQSFFECCLDRSCSYNYKIWINVVLVYSTHVQRYSTQMEKFTWRFPDTYVTSSASKKASINNIRAVYIFNWVILSSDAFASICNECEHETYIFFPHI